jgi:hypothetical protein
MNTASDKPSLPGDPNLTNFSNDGLSAFDNLPVSEKSWRGRAG